MQASNWVAAAEGGAREYVPVSSTPLDQAYQRSKSLTRSEYLGRLESRGAVRDAVIAPAGSFVAAKYQSRTWGSPGASIVLGSDPHVMETSNLAYGITSALPREEIDLLQTVPKMRDTTLDGAHRASMTEGHFLSIWDPYVSQHRIRSASFASAGMLRESMHRHVRSQYHPEEKYVLPPTVQNDIGWGLTLDKYKDACAKFQEGAEWHGRTGENSRLTSSSHCLVPTLPLTACPTSLFIVILSGSHITKFSERLLLGARHHLSGPMTNPKLHY